MTTPEDAAIRHPWEDAPGPGEAVEVAEGILWLRLPLPMRLDHVNVYALDDGDGWTLIDTGIAWAKGRVALEAALDGPLSGRPLRRVVLTHHHPDHIGQAATLARRGAEIWAPRLGYAMGRMLQLDEQARPSDAAVAFRRSAGMPEEMLTRFAAERPFNFADCTEPLPIGFRSICDGEVVRMGGRDWTVRFGHGHAPDLATFWTEGLVLSSDQIIPGISSNIGVYPTEPEADPLAEWLESCARMRDFAAVSDATAPAGLLALPGHKLPFYGAEFRLGQLIDHHVLALDRIMDFLGAANGHGADGDGAKSAVDCFEPIFRRSIGEAIYGLALAEAVAHMNHLFRTDRVSRVLDAAGVWRYRPAA